MQKGISNIQIRMAYPKDIPAIASVLYKSFAEYEALYTTEGFAATTATKDQIKQRMSEGPVWVALLNDIIVGTVSALQARLLVSNSDAQVSRYALKPALIAPLRAAEPN